MVPGKRDLILLITLFTQLSGLSATSGRGQVVNLAVTHPVVFVLRNLPAISAVKAGKGVGLSGIVTGTHFLRAGIAVDGFSGCQVTLLGNSMHLTYLAAVEFVHRNVPGTITSSTGLPVGFRIVFADAGGHVNRVRKRDIDSQLIFDLSRILILQLKPAVVPSSVG